jgi:CheY-like chemotaxis protein
VVGQAQAALHAEARPGEFVRLRVRDSGHGIPADVLPRIFEPFFTTKEVGKGTGLGLAVVYGVVRQHQGWLECSSAVGSGTCFDVYLPRAGAAPAEPAPAAAPAVAGGGETVLLADDEEAIRALGAAILRRYGYEVLLAEDGQQAVDTYEREKHRIGLVVLDLSMPRLSGRDALRRLLQLDPGARVLLASGHPAEELKEPGTEGALGFLTKPYSDRDLAAAVRTALDRGAPEGAPTGAPGSPAGPAPGPALASGAGTHEEAGPGPGSACRAGLTKAEAERLLDWLEANGYQGRELRHEEGGTFEVRWRDEEGLRGGAPVRCRRSQRLPCPHCGSTRRPYMARERTALSWVLLALGLLVWPLLPVGLLLRRDVWRCWDCHRVLGRGRRATLGS